MFIAMPGVVITIVAMVLLVPIGIMFAGAIWSALFGWVSSEDADQRAGGTDAPI